MKSTSFVMPIVVVALLLGCCQAGFAQSREATLPHSMKGYELYSWNVRGEWYFSLLVGTNRLKTNKEVTSSKVRVKGIEALKILLNQLASGEEVSWSAVLVSRMNLPPDKIIQEIKIYCEGRDIILRVNRRGAGRGIKPLLTYPLVPSAEQTSWAAMKAMLSRRRVK